MTQEKYERIKSNYVGHIKHFMVDEGNIFPHLTVFGSPIDKEDEDAIIHIPVPDEFMKSEELKEEFVNTVVPKIAEKIREKFIPYGVAWTSEAWVRTATKDQGVPDNWKDMPIEREVLMINIEFENKQEMMIYDIKRTGKQVNDEGKLTDHIDLIENDMTQAEGWSGRFTGLLNKFRINSL